LDLEAKWIRVRGFSDCVQGNWRETETTQENIQDCIEVGERDSGFQLLTEEKKLLQ
jgi:hypothetical protein